MRSCFRSGSGDFRFSELRSLLTKHRACLLPSNPRRRQRSALALFRSRSALVKKRRSCRSFARRPRRRRRRQGIAVSTFSVLVTHCSLRPPQYQQGGKAIVIFFSETRSPSCKYPGKSWRGRTASCKQPSGRREDRLPLLLFCGNKISCSSIQVEMLLRCPRRRQRRRRRRRHASALAHSPTCERARASWLLLIGVCLLSEMEIDIVQLFTLRSSKGQFLKRQSGHSIFGKRKCSAHFYLPSWE